ncbi:PAS domain-containing hybrid sensor histidine kinase/response regulator [Paractinoplanes rishiriensis]|uniref:PAS domain-containing hybrid sensor histidine kinase/response regulator n=1 Tax=Paractinoplanes rishiriensis TaxID=1050105 RepID=UPI001941E1EC|nr:PAS domain-containing hybrid sensor histidine kinase/response regulator [Actinoplanes rishiriensis]
MTQRSFGDSGLLEAAPDAIVAVTADGLIGLVNAQAERLFGYDRAELLGQPIELLVPEDARDVHPSHRRRYSADAHPRPMGAGMHLAGRRKDGSRFPAEISLSPIDTEQGPLVAAAVRDVSDRIRAEAKFRGLLEAAPDAIVGATSDGTIALVNAQTERLFGYGRDELIGRPVEILIPEYARDAHPGYRDGYLHDPAPRPMGAGMQLAGRRKDGSRFPAEISLSSIDTEDGLLVSAAVRDVSDRIRAEAKFRGLLEAAPDAIIGVTRDGTIALANAQTERLFGYSRNELIGQPIEILVPDRVRSVHPEHRRQYFAQPQPRPMGAGLELSARRKDGTEFWCEISLSSIETEEGTLVSAAVRDITERRRAAEAQNRLATIVQSSHDAIMGKTLDGVITSWNPGAERLYGYTADEMIGRNAEELFPAARRASEAGILARIGRGERVEQYQTERVRKDGSTVTVSLSMSPITDAAGTIIGVASVSRDISERQRAEAKFLSLLEAAPDAIVGVAPDGTIALVNAQVEQLFGYQRDQLLGQPVEILVPEYARDRHPGYRRGYLTDPAPRPMGAGMQLAGRRRDGSHFPAEISLSSIQTDDGILVSAAIRDVTERTRAEAKFRGLLEAAPDAIVGVAADGQITLVNAQAERLFGYHRDELLGQPIEILVPDRVRRVHPAHRTDYFRHPQPRPMGAGTQLAARRKDGTEFPAEISLSALDTEDGPIVSAAIRDVTDRIEAQAERERLKAAAERERLEAQLHQAQRLESLGQLAGGVAHDFNNLLAVMLNYTTFVAEEIADAADREGGRWPQVSHDIRQIQRAGERATELTHQLLAFGRREVVRPQVLNLNTVVAEIEALLQRTLGEHIQLHTTPDPHLWPVLADPGQLEQVLVNLAVNARDAMPDGGTLSIDTTNLTIADTTTAPPGLRTGRYVKLRVADTGTGIAPDVAERVFEPFFTTKPKGEGTGLGLATVYGIITQAGGHADIRSCPDAGTAFTAYLPATDQQPEQVEQPTAPAPRSHSGETVLVVEDEEALREVTRRILSRNGYHVLTAHNGPEALKIAEQCTHDIHLLLTDVIMPHMLGKELATKIRDLSPHTRVLYMSGYAQPVLASQGTLDPGVILVEKPFSETTLLDRIRTVLDPP